jgi:hypothetical protein
VKVTISEGFVTGKKLISLISAENKADYQLPLPLVNEPKTMSNTVLTFIIDIIHLISYVLGLCQALRNKLWTRFSAFSILLFQISDFFGGLLVSNFLK